MKTSYRIKAVLVFGAIVFGSLGVFAGSAQANHSWVDYHWARSSDPFTVKLGNDVSSAWSAYLTQASSDWSASSVLHTTIVTGLVSPRTCKGTTGQDEVCSATYGNTGWLGLASIWLDSLHHITKGTVKLNDTYFNTATYNTPGWRHLVACQEVGHTFGLDHQDTTFNNVNLGTCMDYTNAPAGGTVGSFNYGASNEHPNQGDYDQLLCIYDPASNGKTLSTATHSCTGTGHLDSYTTIQALITKAAGLATAARAQEKIGSENTDFGRAIGYDAKGRADVFEKDLGNGEKTITHVFWLPD
ncbi:MAG: hypothetical protein HY221_00415 [Candidatus Sungbacteria bacterium]|uniref:Peptidase M10 metallopeptidase domain-containing protein n=1 Tax=Candidatus Sungiibacteriota bacterium TaxID=2750080 RepID=A0A932R0J6_9BACT|nr:hypothetical protein [Candidatus Sungbacteria bacterium]